MRKLGWLLAGLLVLQLSGRAVAGPDESTEAKRLYEEGTAAYNLGDFPNAISNYKAAYKLHHDPTLLFNIAQAYRLSSDFAQALFFYKSYLRAKPDAPNADDVQKRIGDLEDQVSKQKQSSTAPPMGTLPAVDTPENPPTKVKIPPPETAATATPATAPETTPAPPPSQGGHRPVYKKWWFWTGLGAIAVGAVVVVAVSSGGGASGPSTTLGTTHVF